VRSSRLVNILLLLQTRGRMTAEELADELEVSTRTVYRDLDALGEAGVPVYVERGRRGGAQLVDGYRTRLTGLDADEAEALFLSGLPGPAADLGLGTVLAAAQLKVMAALPAELRSRAARIRERFFLDAPGWFKGGEEHPQLPTLASAVWDERRVRIRYQREGELVERVIEPLGLVLKGGSWYVVARRDGVFRTYRVTRVLEAEALDEHFDRPRSFELGAHWVAAAAEFEESLELVDVTLRVDPGAIGALGYSVGASRVRAALAEAGAPDDDGWWTITIGLESLEWAHDDLLRAGAGVEVLAPAELRDAIAETAKTLATRYAGEAGRSRLPPARPARVASGAARAASPPAGR
jgi:predicted DNA-binding transcriptional regulator YafY